MASKASRWRLLLPATFVVAAFAVVAVAVAPLLVRPRVSVPTPNAELLRLQRAAAHGDSSALDHAMIEYRQRMHAELKRQYGEAP